MAARVQVVIEARDASSGVLRAITGQLGGLGGVVEELTAKNISWGNVAERAATMVINGVKDAYKVTTEYVEAVRDQALASGQSAEAASRFLQVLDDYQLSAEDAKVATRALTREGLAPTVETLIQLSSEYQKLATVEEKNLFVQQKLGRAGQQWLNLLNQGPDAIRAMNEAVNENLIVTDESVAALEKWRLEVDKFNDEMQGLKIQTMLPILEDWNRAVEGAEQDQRAWAYAQTATASETESLADAQERLFWEFIRSEEQGKYYAKMMEALSPTIADVTDNTEELAQVADNLKAALSGDFIQAHENYDEKMGELEKEASELTAELERLQKEGVKKNSDEIQTLTERLRETRKAQDELGRATDKTIAKMIYQQAAASLDAEGQLELARRLGLVSEEDYAIAKAIDDLTDKYDSNNDGVVSATEATEDYISALENLNNGLQALPDKVTTTVVTNFVTTGTPPAGQNVALCFIEDTPVHVDEKTTKPIQEIRAGDTVIAYDTKTGEKVKAVVSKVFHHAPSEMLDFFHLRINEIGVTKEHKFYVNGKWKPAAQIKVGDELLGFDGKPVTVTRIQAIYRRVWTYNLHVEELHNYYACGILVHNGKSYAQQGNVVYAGQPAIVGESGAEPFIPSQNGRVLSHAESIHALTAGGTTNYFYGNVTISADSEAGGDVMSIR